MKYREPCKYCQGKGYTEQELSLADADISSSGIRLGDIVALNDSGLKQCALDFVVRLGLAKVPDPGTVIKALQSLPKSRNRDLLIGIIEAREPVKAKREDSPEHLTK